MRGSEVPLGTLVLCLACLRGFVVKTLTKHAAELCKRSGIARENGLEIRSAEVLRGKLAKHVAEISSQGQVATFVQLIALQPRPVAVDFSPTQPVPNHEHRICMSRIIPS